MLRRKSKEFKGACSETGIEYDLRNSLNAFPSTERGSGIERSVIRGSFGAGIPTAGGVIAATLKYAASIPGPQKALIIIGGVLLTGYAVIRGGNRAETRYREKHPLEDSSPL
jgi:hypothetical protein